MKILLAIDDSESSKAAVNALIQQMRSADTEVRVLNVVEPRRLAPPFAGSGIGPSIPADYAGIVEEWADEAEVLVAQVGKVLEGAGFSVATVIKEGDAKREILKFSEEWQPDLIVVGSHGRTGVDRFLLGSVSEAVARHATCSVQIVRPATAFAQSD